MPRHTLLTPLLALLLASPVVLSQDASPTPAAQAQPAPQPEHGRQGHRMHHHLRMAHRERMGAFSDLRALERLYREAGRTKELAGVYNDVLAKSQDPHLRTYAYHQLARLQAQPAHVDQAIATLRKSLAENLAHEAERRAEHERMRAQWQQRAAMPQPAR